MLCLFTIQFHDQLFLDIFRDTFSFRISDEGSLHFCFIPVEPVDPVTLSFCGAVDTSITLRGGLESNHISWFQLERRHIHDLTIYCNMFMGNKLARTGTG